jgi:hypothetical protein
MPAQIGYSRGRKNQPVYAKRRRPPKGYAPNQGSGRPGRPSSNQIRKVLNGRVHGVSVMRSHGSKGGKDHVARGFPPGGSPQPAKASRKLDKASHGSSAGPSAPAYNAVPRRRRIVRSQIAG